MHRPRLVHQGRETQAVQEKALLPTSRTVEKRMRARMAAVRILAATEDEGSSSRSHKNLRTPTKRCPSYFAASSNSSAKRPGKTGSHPLASVLWDRAIRPAHARTTERTRTQATTACLLCKTSLPILDEDALCSCAASGRASGI
eukprot:scaffold1_cov402-Prasinococcus_capsulatus_cf.AAC.42